MRLKPAASPGKQINSEMENTGYPAMGGADTGTIRIIYKIRSDWVEVAVMIMAWVNQLQRSREVND